MMAGRTGDLEGADWLRLHHVAMAEFDVRVRLIPPDHWEASTPCEEWDVHDLVRHNTVENLWVRPILDGLSVADVGDAFDGDVLGSDPESVWEASRREALEAFDGADLDGEVALTRGATPTLEYLQERVFDLLVHAWDLARGIGGDERLDDEVVQAVWDWARPMAPMFADFPELFEPPVPVDPDDDLQTRLLHLTGRQV